MTMASKLINHKVVSILLILIASIFIYGIAQLIQQLLVSYELTPMYISFCAGFILFTPLVSLALHPLLLANTDKAARLKTSALIVNVGLVMLVQGLFFLIWITDAIAIYSIYVDSNSFLAKAFNISSQNTDSLDKEFYIANVLLAWLFALLSLVIGVMPCLIARLKNLGVVGNFVASFSYFKGHKIQLLGYAFCLSAVVLLPLLFMDLLFIVLFPLTLTWIFISIARTYLAIQ